MQTAYEFLHFHQHFWTKRLDALVDFVRLQGKPPGKHKKQEDES